MKLILSMVLFLSSSWTIVGQQAACAQPSAERDDLMNEAQRNQFTVRRVEFLGLTYTRDTLVRGRMGPVMNEGDLFTRQRLLRSLRRVNTLKRIYPVRLRHVEVRLDRPERLIDMTICFTERRRHRSN